MTDREELFYLDTWITAFEKGALSVLATQMCKELSNGFEQEHDEKLKRLFDLRAKLAGQIVT